MRKSFISCLCVVFLISCNNGNRKSDSEVSKSVHDTIIVDCNYTFEQAVAGTDAPQSVIDQLELITVHYYSTDNKLHRGQILTNKRIATDLREIFRDMRQLKFPIAKVIPVVRYKWDDEASMSDNNTYSFCYRDISYSKHAFGLAIDLNPFFNPNRWKPEYSYRKDVPEGAVRDTTVPGTIYESHPVVELFRKKGFFWGHNFRRNHDDHHFEKK